MLNKILIGFYILGFALISQSFANTFFDKNTGLMWQDNLELKTLKKDWLASKEYCENLTLDNYNDWSLASLKQLLTISDKSKNDPAYIDGISENYSTIFWSSTTNALLTKTAWYVDFKIGSTDNSNKTDINHFRCVRVHKTATNNNFNVLVEKFIKEEFKPIEEPKKELKLVKDEFETSEEFKKRVIDTKENQKKLIEKYKKDLFLEKLRAKKVAIKKTLELTWGKPIISELKYDADNSYFIANINFEMKKDFNKKIAINVDRELARDFKTNFTSLKPIAIFDYVNSSVSLKNIKIPYMNKEFIAVFTDLSLEDTKVAINLKDEFGPSIDVDTNISVDNSNMNTLNTNKLKDFEHIEKLLDKTKQVKIDEKKWLFVVGIEQYEFTDNISFAAKSANTFEKVMKKSLGIADTNSFVMVDNGATQAKIKTNFKRMLRKVKDGDTIYFYYNGHGVPVPNLENEPFMLASDTEPDYVADEEFFALKNIYGKLSSSKASKVVAFVDSCFSGVTDGKAVLKGVAATKMKSKKVSFDKEKMVVISAGKSHQYSNAFNQKAHRLFSFYIMQNILEGNNDIKSLYKETKKETYQTSIEEYGDIRVQEPTLDGNGRLDL